ncbi:MAG: hypothetical protein Q9222_002018 [Ikaeria aurantiellina]
MAAAKRKAALEQGVARPEKKPRTSQHNPIPVSLRKEEVPFPRGGGSVLTPLEQKQIQIQAKNDALFEQTTGKKAPSNAYADQEEDGEVSSQDEVQRSKAQRKTRMKSKPVKAHSAIEEKSVRIEGLSYKRLTPGSLVLGQVSQINRYDVALSLPNNLTGYVPITSISSQLTARIEKQMEVDEEEDIEVEGNDLNLSSYFVIGQYLRASVVATEKQGMNGAKSKKHIELSINPRQANAGLTHSSLPVNTTLQAAVKSVEDHGLIMDLGIEGAAIKGFMSSKELGKRVQISSVREGVVFLCLVTGLSSNGAVVKLSADPQKIGNVRKGAYITDAPTIDCFLPGTAIELMVSEVTKFGLLGKAMGVLDVTADLVQSGAIVYGKDLDSRYSAGDKIKGRIICTFPDAEPRKLGISLLDHVTSLHDYPLSTHQESKNLIPTEILPLSTIVDEVKVVKVEPTVGLLVDVNVKGIRGFVHISRITDGKTETLTHTTGPYKVGSVHKARVIGYNHMDGMYILSLEPRVIAQPFLRIEDVRVGQMVEGTIEKLLINETGVNGIIVTLAEGITGLVPEVHFSDVHLQHPEKRFKEGASVTARVLSTLPAKRQLRLTLKKTLVNSDEVWKSYDELAVGAEAPGTVVNIIQFGAVLQFYGSVRGFLPVSEMSESFIEDPKKHFKIGQAVHVRIVSVSSAEKRMIVSCRDASSFGAAQQEQLKSVTIGTTVGGLVSEKINDAIILELDGSNIKSILPFEHLTDGSSQKAASAAKKIRVGQHMEDLIVLSKAEGKHLVQLSSKPSLVKAAQSRRLLKTFEHIQEGVQVDGYVNNITASGVFVQFAGGMSGLLPKTQMMDDAASLPDFGLRRHQSISPHILSLDHMRQRFLLTMKPRVSAEVEKEHAEKVSSSAPDGRLVDPVDGMSSNISDFSLAKLTKARISSIKETQLNVQLAEGVQGRVDVSEVFDTLEDIRDRKHPLKSFRSNQVLPVRILGMHDSRNHRFLPITHRSKAPVFELTAKPKDQIATSLDVLTLDKVHVNSTYLVFINNAAEDCVWVNLSPNVRGRIKALNLSDDVSLLRDIAKNFPVGSALKATVVYVDVPNNRLDLRARHGASTKALSISDLSIGMVLPGRVTKVNERQIMVQLNETLSGPVNLTDLADDFSAANPTSYEKYQIIRVCVQHIDLPNKRIFLSTRPSRVLSSGLPVEDREINALSDLHVNDFVRGFIKNVADNGIFVSLSSSVTAFVRVSDLSDLYLKDWKSHFEVDQLVKGKVLQVDNTANHVQLSLKKSHIDKDYRPPMTFHDIEIGQVVTGKVRKVEDFGVFVVFDESANVSGLCHRSQMADGKSADPKKLYEAGDVVKAKVLKIDGTMKRISLGLKASLFHSGNDTEAGGKGDNLTSSRPVRVVSGDGEDSEVEKIKEMLAASDGEADDWDGLQDDESREQDADMIDEDNGGVNLGDDAVGSQNTSGLDAGGFDWGGGLADSATEDLATESDTSSVQPKTKKKKRRKVEIQVDRTGDLDAHGPRSVADFERLLLGQPNSSVLWMKYMAFRLELQEVEKAREIAERALRTIHIREQDEKFRVWVAMLQLENHYGSDESVEKVFQRACQHCDSLEIHEELISIYITSGHQEKASALFDTALSKHGAQSPSLWLNAATFHLTTLNSQSTARAYLPRALQSLPAHAHVQLTSKFAHLEFTSPNGDPERGRTMFEGLLSTFPRRLDLWNVYMDLEIKIADKKRVRGLFERIVKLDVKPQKMKFWFKKWEAWEKEKGDEKGRDKVRKLAEEFVSRVAEAKGKGLESGVPPED